MDKSKLYSIFLDFIGGDSIEMEGLYLKPERIMRDGHTIEFSIQNPNDVSYYTEVVIEYLDEIIHDFKETASLKNIKLELIEIPAFIGTAGH